MTGIEFLRARLNEPVSGMAATLAFRLVAVEAGRVALAADPGPAVLNLFVIVHGGWTATLLDSAMGSAASTLLGVGQVVSTVELKAAYHRPVTLDTGTVRVEGHVVSSGRRLVFAEAKLTDGTGRLLASGSATLMILEPKPSITTV